MVKAKYFKHERDKILYEIFNSKAKKLKRDQIDLIDNIHINSMESIEDKIKRIEPKMKKWSSKQDEPINYEISILKTLDEIEREEKRQVWLDSTHAEVYDLHRYKENIKKLKAFCLAHNIDTKALDPQNRKYLTEQQLIEELFYGMNHPFMYYKKAGQLNKTFVNCKLKQKDKSRMEVRQENIIDFCRKAYLPKKKETKKSLLQMTKRRPKV